MWVFLNSVSIPVCFQAPRTAPANSVRDVVEVRASFDPRVVGLLSQFGLCLDSLERDLSEFETEKHRELETEKSSERVRDFERVTPFLAFLN